MMRTEARQSDMFGIYIKLTGMALLWGGTFIAGRMITVDMPPYLAAILRFLIASFLLVCLMLKSHAFKKVRPIQMLLLAGMGLTGVVTYNLFFFSALSHIAAGRTALFVSLSPILTVLFARLLFKEKLSRLNYAGVFFAFIGTLTVVTRGSLFAQFNQSFGYGEMMMCGAVFSWVIYTLLSKQLKNLPSLLTITYSTLWGTLFLLISAIPHISEWQHIHMTWTDFYCAFYLGGLGTVLAFIWYTQGIQEIGASRTVIFNSFVPMFAVLLSFFILSEPISFSMLAGGLLSLLGVLLTNKRSAPSLTDNKKNKGHS